MDREERQRLSKMLFEARETIEMFGDVVWVREGRADKRLEQLIAEIDSYRHEQGWSPNGYGGED